MRRRWGALVVLALAAGIPSGARAWSVVQEYRQPERRDGSGRVTVEAATVHVVDCYGPGENGSQVYVYGYANREGFRAVRPPDWNRALGGREFPTEEEAIRAGCGVEESDWWIPAEDADQR